MKFDSILANLASEKFYIEISQSHEKLVHIEKMYCNYACLPSKTNFHFYAFSICPGTDQ